MHTVRIKIAIRKCKNKLNLNLNFQQQAQVLKCVKISLEWTTQNANVHTQCVLQHVMIVVSLFHFSYGRNELEAKEWKEKYIYGIK